MKIANQKWLLASFGTVLLSTAFLSGCQAVEGVGRDIENLGDEIADESEEQQRENRRNDRD